APQELPWVSMSRKQAPRRLCYQRRRGARYGTQTRRDSMCAAALTPCERTAVGGVRGSNPLHQRATSKRITRWKVERGARRNYRLLGRRLAEANQDLYRNGTNGRGLIHVLAGGTHRLITKAGQLAPIIVDNLILQITKDGKVTGDLPPATHLNAMLSSETFLA